MFLFFGKPENPCDKYLNCISRYHIYVFALLFLSKASLLWHVLNIVFLSPAMEYTCKDEGAPETLNYCPCNTPEWNKTTFTETMQSFYKLQCEKTLVLASNMLHYTGMLVGALFFGFIADMVGRLKTYSATFATFGTAGVLISMAPNITMYIVCRFFEGFGVGGAIVTSYVLCIEYAGINYREIITALFHLPLNVGHVAIGAVSYFLRDFRQFQLAASIPMYMFCFLYFLMRDSPRWLMEHKKVDQVVFILKKIHPKSNANFKREVQSYMSYRSKEKRGKLTDIFKDKRLTTNFVCMGVNYFVCGMGYYGVTSFVGKLGEDVHVNHMIGGVVLLPGTIFCCVFLNRISRKLFLMATNLLAGILMLVVAFLPSGKISVLVACFSNTFFFMSFLIAFLYGVELFPTSVRNSVLGCLSVMSRFAQILNPLITSLDNMYAGCIFGSCAILGGVLCCFLPNPKGTELPTSLFDASHIKKK